MKERIICAAIHVPKLQKTWYGHRHNDCIEAMNGELSWTMNRQEISAIEKIQGFVTSDGRFVDRKDGLKIALENNQVLNVAEIRGNQLYSEDLY